MKKNDGYILRLAKIEPMSYDPLRTEEVMITQMNSVLNKLSLKAQCIGAKSHRHLSYYDLQLLSGCSVRRLESFAREIALELKSKTVPIIKVIPEKGVVRLRVATDVAKLITVERVINGSYIPGYSEMFFPFCLGESDDGEKLWTDLAKHPHTLVAGGTGSGKSVLLHNLIANAAYLDAHGYREVEIHLADPKRVEFVAYENSLSPVMTVVSSYEDIVNMLSGNELEMEFRYRKMSSIGIKSIEEQPDLFPLRLIIIDEVADIMAQDKRGKKFEKLVVKLAQKARAAGIYLVLATQRPSVDVLTGLIKANFPARIACKTASQIDSKVIMDFAGAETLLGRGDAIMKNMTQDYVRFQVAFANPQTTIKTYNWIRRNVGLKN